MSFSIQWIIPQRILTRFQVLYPIGLAAAIFSMQQEAIPFELTPRSFTLTVFLLIVMVHIVRIMGRYVLSRWPLLPKTVALWLKREKMDAVENDKEPSVLLPWFRMGMRPMPDVCLDRIQMLGTEEGNLGTRALLGRPGEVRNSAPSTPTVVVDF
jgi:hypothetical protein